MISSYCFNDGVSQVAFNLNLDSHRVINANSQLIFKPKFLRISN